MDSSTKNALFIVGIVLSTIVVAFVSLLIGAMVISPAEPEEQPVVINFYIEEYAEDVFTLSGEIGEVITLPTAEECEFEKEGYTLKNWAIEEDEEITTYNPGDQITLRTGLSFYGVWEENVPDVPDEPTPTMYTVKLFADSTLQNALLTTEVEENTNFAFPTIQSLNYQKQGFEFVCWSDGENTYNPTQTIQVEDNLNFYAVWEENEPEPTIYTINLYADSTLQDVIYTTEVEENTNFAFPTIQSLNYQKQGFEFVCWSDGIHTYNQQTIQVNGNLNFYAVWEEKEPEDPTTDDPELKSTYTVKFIYDIPYNDELISYTDFEFEVKRSENVLLFYDCFWQNGWSGSTKATPVSIKFYTKDGTIYYSGDVIENIQEDIEIHHLVENDYNREISEYTYQIVMIPKCEFNDYYPGDLGEANFYHRFLYLFNATEFVLPVCNYYEYDSIDSTPTSIVNVSKWENFVNSMEWECGETVNLKSLNPEVGKQFYVFCGKTDEEITPDEPEEYVDDKGVVYHKVTTPMQGYELFDAKDLEDNEYEIPETINGVPVIKISENAFNENLTKLKIRSNIVLENIDKVSEEIDIYILPKNYEIYYVALQDRQIYQLLDDADIIDEDNCVYGVEIVNGRYKDFQGVQYKLKTDKSGNDYWEVDYLGEVTTYGTLKFLSGINNIPVKKINKDSNGTLFHYVDEIIIPRTITEIVQTDGGSTFAKTSSIIVQEGNPVFDSRNNCNAVCNYYNSLVAACANTIIPNTIRYIGLAAFSGLDQLTSITIPNSVIYIFSYAFEDCNNLELISIPNSVIEIDGRAFENCVSLTSITIPNSVQTIGAYAFYDCTGLEQVIFEEGSNLTQIGDGAFYCCTKLESITIPNSVTEIGNNPFRGCTSLTQFNSENSKFVVSEDHRCLINNGKLIAFAYSGLTEYTIPDYVTGINLSSFDYSTNLTISIPTNVIEFTGSSSNELSIKLLGRLTGFDIHSNRGGPIYVKASDYSWYFDRWQLSADPEDDNYYGNYNIYTY